MPVNTPFTLPRKMNGTDIGALAKDKGQVHSVCRVIFQRGQEAGRKDSFIGLVNILNWKFYLAPCVGIRNKSELEKRSLSEKIKEPTNELLLQALPCDWTDTQDYQDAAHLESVYGEGNVCYVEMPELDFKSRQFDGRSHSAMHQWVLKHAGIKEESFRHNALGFSIQYDSKNGCYIRFASGLNQGNGRISSGARVPVFEDRSDESAARAARQKKESRDMPKQWAIFCENVLARDLCLGLLRPDDQKFERVCTRNDETTKMSYFSTNRSYGDGIGSNTTLVG